HRDLAILALHDALPICREAYGGEIADAIATRGNIPGFGDQREIELPVEAGFTPLQAICIATLNGATFLGRQDQIGSIAVGKNARSEEHTSELQSPDHLV